MSSLSILFWTITITNVLMVHCIEPLNTTVDSPSASLKTPKLLTTPLGQCKNFICLDDKLNLGTNGWPLPISKVGDKAFLLGIFFKANWFRASQFCRFYSMNLASISNQLENDQLAKLIRQTGVGNEGFWTSGNDLAIEGDFFWMSNGQTLTYKNWFPGEPNNMKHPNGDNEHCLEFFYSTGQWNDNRCSIEKYFICQI